MLTLHNITLLRTPTHVHALTQDGTLHILHTNLFTFLLSHPMKMHASDTHICTHTYTRSRVQTYSLVHTFTLNTQSCTENARTLYHTYSHIHPHKRSYSYTRVHAHTSAHTYQTNERSNILLLCNIKSHA